MEDRYWWLPPNVPIGTKIVDNLLCNVYPNLNGSQPEYDGWVDVANPIKVLDPMVSDCGDDEVVAGLSQQELYDTADILKGVEAGKEALGAVVQELVKRASQREEDGVICLEKDPAGAEAERWTVARKVAVITNDNTKAANASSMRAFASFLSSQHPDITTEPHLIPQEQLKKLIAEFVTKAKRQDGVDYKRNSLLGMIRGVLRAINAKYTEMQLQHQAAPPKITLTEDLALHATTDAVCKQLSAEGKGTTTKQPGLTLPEMDQAISYLASMEETSKHTIKTALVLATNWGGRISEVSSLKASAFERTTDTSGRPCIKFTVPDHIKQNQGGLHKSSGAQDLEDTPSIMLYENSVHEILCPLAWHAADQKYREASSAASKKGRLWKPQL